MSRQTSTRFSFLLNLASSASLPGGTFSYTRLSDGTKVSARADDDFGARMYDPFTARWTAVDPMAAKYPGHSPFNYCEGNAINRIDPQGDTIVVLYARNAVGGLGHMAILVQDENGVYRLWSKNGDKIKDVEHEDNINEAIDDIQSFLDGINNVPGHKTSNGEPYYTEGYMIATTPEQDASITNSMRKKTKRSYKPLEHTVPKSTYNSIKQANPGGKIYKPSK